MSLRETVISIAGHILRLPNSCLANAAFNWKPVGEEKEGTAMLYLAQYDPNTEFLMDMS